MNKTIDLRQPKHDFRTVAVGTIVITSAGFKFKLMARKKGKESWKDISTKLTWHDREDEIYTHYKAVEKFGGSLPTIQEFQEAEKHGFREVLPNMNYCFWSASVVSTNRNSAWYFYSYNGIVYSSNHYTSYPVRCVGR